MKISSGFCELESICWRQTHDFTVPQYLREKVKPFGIQYQINESYEDDLIINFDIYHLNKLIFLEIVW